MTTGNRIGMDSTSSTLDLPSSSSFWRADPSSFDGNFISTWRDHHPHDYPSFRFPDPHYDPSSAYYHPETAMDVYGASSSTTYPSYISHQSSSSPPPSAPLQSSSNLFNSHPVQYSSAYGTSSSTSAFTNSSYENFYHSNAASHYPFVSHGSDMKGTHRSSACLPSDPVTSKQAMFLSAAAAAAAANYDYKDLSKLCDFLPTPATSSSNGSNDKRNPWSTSKSSSNPLKTNEGRINRCRICGKIYARPSTLKTHLRTHSGEKPYKCDKCSKAFTQAANLTAHLRTHSGEKPFACDICGRKFSQSSSVTTHMRTHSGERPYQCKFCRKAFSDSSTLTKHMRVHSGEKPYECSLCRLRFSQSGNLNRHMRIHMNGGNHHPSK